MIDTLIIEEKFESGKDDQVGYCMLKFKQSSFGWGAP